MGDGFFKGYKDCKKFEFKVTKRNDIERVLRYFQNKEFAPIPKELLVKAE